MDAGLSKKERLCSVTDIEHLVSHGRYTTRGHIRCCFCPGKKEYTRIMVSVPKKFFRRAVRRNLLKRRIREAYRLNKQLLAQSSALDIMFVYTSKEIDSFEQISAAVVELLQSMR